MTHSRNTCDSASCTICYPQPFSSKPLARRSGQAPRPVTGPDGDDPITDEQIREVLRIAQKSGDTKLAACAARAIDGDSLYHRDIVTRCAAAYNARHAGKDLP